MSRHGYNEYGDSTEWQMICWRGAVKKAIDGKRGQAFLRELLETLDKLPEKKLIAEELVTPSGEVCAIGSVMVARGIDASKICPDEHEYIAQKIGIAPALVQEIEYINDESQAYGGITDQKRFDIVRDWAVRHIK